MTKRTTDDWEALLDGTTPGPWGCRWDEGHLAIVGPDEEAIAFDADERDSNLIVAAPEAVAEVVRLRRALEQLRDACLESAKSCEHNAQHSHDSQALLAMADVDLDTAENITRILNPRRRKPMSETEWSNDD